MDINLIVAIGKNGAIGRKGDLIWHISDDLKRFKQLTMGHPVIMGRKTWESLPKRPLPGRKNIVLTTNPALQAEGAVVVNSIESAIAAAYGKSPFIMGGAQIYNAFLPYVTHAFVTQIDAECPDADAFLNIDFTSPQWEKTKETAPSLTSQGIPYRYVNYSKNH